MKRIACLMIILSNGLVMVSALPSHPANSVPSGVWGGPHIRMNVSKAGADIEYDCAFGTIDEPLMVSEDGHFKVHGTHAAERGGPYRIGETPPKRHPATYYGWTDGHQMRLTVKLPEKNEVVGTFSLCLGCPARLEKCL